MADTSIEWTDATWNPVAGCTIVSPGCTNCYALRMAARLDAMGTAKYRGLTRKSGKRAVWTGKIALNHRALEAPKAWKKPRQIFVNSMSDLFHDGVPVEFVRAGLAHDGSGAMAYLSNPDQAP
jgi:protein gp37